MRITSPTLAAPLLEAVLAVEAMRVTLLLPLLPRRGVASADPVNAWVLVLHKQRRAAADNSMRALMMRP